MNNREETIRKMNEGLAQMVERGHQDTESYERLKAKRDAIASGAEYRIVDRAPALIAGFGAMIPSVNYTMRDGKIERILKDRSQFLNQVEQYAENLMEDFKGREQA